MQPCILSTFLFLIPLTAAFTVIRGNPTIPSQISVPRDFTDDPNSVYVDGGGFSGFWFLVGRLQSLPNPQDKTYHCVSAGAFGAVAALNNITMDELYAKWSHVTSKWDNGVITRHELVDNFITELIYGDPVVETTRPLPSPRIDQSTLSRLNIITTVRDGWGLKHVSRTPGNMRELREMLLQTSWIPFVVGSGLWNMGHMDGGFSFFQHPKCAHTVRVRPDLDLLSNFLTVGLGRQKAEKYWKAGLEYA